VSGDEAGQRPLFGRLFWKVFIASWAALTLASLAVGGVVWLSHAQQRDGGRGIDQGPAGLLLVDAAVIVAGRAGRSGLVELLAQTARRDGRPGPTLYVVGEDDADLLGRPVQADVLAAARAAVGNDRAAVRRLAVDGGELLLFVPGPPRPVGVGAPPANADPGRPPPKFGPGGPGPREPWLQPLLVPLATSLVGSALLAALLAWYFARPIRALAWAFGRAARGDLAVRVAPRIGGRRDEVADLGRRFDAMVLQLDELLQTQRRLFHDVSHELRSPLARMQVCVGLARRDPAQAAAMRGPTELEAEKMCALIGAVLKLARLEAGIDLSREKQPTGVAALLATLLDEARIEAGARGVTIAFRPATECVLPAQPQLLRRAFGNVLRNALQHAPEGSTVEVELAVDCDCAVRITDRGPGLGDEELAAVFQPFVRGPGRHGEGFGLGLAIAQRAVQAHGGRIEAARRDGGGLVVRIALPR